MSDEPKPQTPMPKYRSHEEVSALEIASVVTKTGGWELHFNDSAFAPREVAGQWFRKHSPDLAEADGGLSGGFFVIYSDGEESWSPKAAFEANHTRI